MYRRYQNSYEIQAAEINAAAREARRAELEAAQRRESGYIQGKSSAHAPRGELIVPERPQVAEKKGSIFDTLFGRFEADDIILLALIFLLISEKNNDKILLLILGYLFIAGL